MEKNTKLYIIGGLVALAAILGGLKYLANLETKPGPLDGFASCLKDKGAVFYGAFWCPHCADQKKIFGTSKRLLPYQECSAPNAQDQLKECTDIGIKTYPTWRFADKSEITGEVSLKTLSEKTGCELPAENK